MSAVRVPTPAERNCNCNCIPSLWDSDTQPGPRRPTVLQLVGTQRVSCRCNICHSSPHHSRVPCRASRTVQLGHTPLDERQDFSI